MNIQKIYNLENELISAEEYKKLNFFERQRIKKYNRNLRKIKYQKAKKEYFKMRTPLSKILKFLLNIVVKPFLFIGGIFVVCSLIGFILIWPHIKAARETSFDTLRNLDKSYFSTIYNGTTIYDTDGNVIGEINTKHFEYVKLQDVSPYIIDGYIAVEDQNFKSHIGIDPKAIIRAGIKLIQNRGEKTQGGSTITQQLIKNTLLTSEKTYTRKLTEIIMAIDLEAQKDVTKEQIMEWYVNSNFYGNNNYGIQAASNYYFGVDVKDVSVAQAAMLIGISNAPSRYDPVSHYETCIENAKYIISVMYESNSITEEEYSQALEDFENKIEIVKYRKDAENNNFSYPVTYALHCATLDLMELNGFEFKYIFESENEETQYKEYYSSEYSKCMNEIRSGGYDIYTSINMKLQDELQETIDKNMGQYTDCTEDGIYKMQASAVCIDNNSNYVVAIVGGRSESGEYNRAYQSARQPGSSIKPLLDYGPAIDNHYYNPGTYVLDEEIEGVYSPSNWYAGYKGSVTIRYALEQSINTVAYQLLADVSPKVGLSYLSKMRFSRLDYEDSESLAIALGGFTYGVSPLEMAKGYNTIFNNGNYSERTCIKKIIQKNNLLINHEKKEKLTPVYSEDTAFLLTDMLKSAVYSGMCGAAKVDGQIVAGKTGTTNDNKDAWFCGFTNYYTLAFWVGMDIPQKTNIQSTWVANMWAQYMKRICEDFPSVDFEKPESVVIIDNEYVSTLNGDADGYDPFDKINDEHKIDADIRKAISVFINFSIDSQDDADQYSVVFNNALSALQQLEGADYYIYWDKIVNKKADLDIQYHNWSSNHWQQNEE